MALVANFHPHFEYPGFLHTFSTSPGFRISKSSRLASLVNANKSNTACRRCRLGRDGVGRKARYAFLVPPDLFCMHFLAPEILYISKWSKPASLVHFENKQRCVHPLSLVSLWRWSQVSILMSPAGGIVANLSTEVNCAALWFDVARRRDRPPS